MKRRPKGAFVDESGIALSTDLYEFTMAAGYFAAGKSDRAVFELFIRDLPPRRGYLVACGLEQALHGILNFRVSQDDVEYLRSLPAMKGVPPAFFDALVGMRFTGDVWAVPEGTVVFAGEPLLRVRAPIIQAQLLETYVLSQINYGTLVATKAARVVEAARGRPVIDFGSRRAHGPGAGLLAARAAYAGGCVGTSNALAGRTFGIPVYGTAAHSWTMAWETEEEAFRRYRDIFPDAVLLVDTYDSIEGTRRAMATGPGLGGVRLDSGNIVALSKRIRKILEDGGQSQARIVASGDLNEYRIDELLSKGAEIDSFGVGTELVTSFDCPALGAVYKLVETDGRPAAKSSEGKETYPGVKQVFRLRSESGEFARDIVAIDGEAQDGDALLLPFVERGELISDYPSLDETRELAGRQLEALPGRFRDLRSPAPFPVGPSEELERLRRDIQENSR